MKFIQKIFLAFACYSASLVFAAYPDKQIVMVVPYAPAGSTDVLGRILAQVMSKDLGQTVIVENTGGAGGTIGSARVAKANPDGYTLLFASLSHNVNRVLLKEKAEYDPLNNFAPISLGAVLPLVVVTAPDSPYNSVADLVAAAKKTPDSISYGSAGNGGSAHLAGALTATVAGVKMLHVPFRGNAPALTEVMAGRVSFMFYPMIGIANMVADKRLKILAVGTSQPMPEFPGIPTMDASGYKDFEQTAPWVGLLAPAGTPEVIINKLNAAMNVALKQPEVVKRMKDLGATPSGNSPAEFRAFLTQDLERWAKVVEASGIKAD
jgi:tripartite-type tricarboxylate transporter receptor subunit TctC